MTNRKIALRIVQMCSRDYLSDRNYRIMENFTKREIEVVYQLLMGLDNKEISKNLCISQHTTKAHLASIYKKLGVTNRLQATIKCFSLCTKKQLRQKDIELALNDV